MGGAGRGTEKLVLNVATLGCGVAACQAWARLSMPTNYWGLGRTS